MFPKMENAMVPDITRGAISLPKISRKKTVAMSSSESSRLSNETAQSYTAVSYHGIYRREGLPTYETFTSTNSTPIVLIAAIVDFANIFFGRETSLRTYLESAGTSNISGALMQSKSIHDLQKKAAHSR